MLHLKELVKKSRENRCSSNDFKTICNVPIKINMSDDHKPSVIGRSSVNINNDAEIGEFIEVFGHLVNDIRVDVNTSVRVDGFHSVIAKCFELKHLRRFHILSGVKRELPLHDLVFEEVVVLSMECIHFSSELDLLHHFPNLQTLDVTSVTANNSDFFASHLPRLTHLTISYQATNLKLGEFEPDICKMYAMNKQLSKLFLKFYQKECRDVFELIRVLKLEPRIKYVALEILLEQTNWSACQLAFLLGLCEHFEKCIVTVQPKPENHKIMKLKQLLELSWLCGDGNDGMTYNFEKN